MLKSLVSIEKEFSMEEVANATPDWLKIVMLVFVITVIFTAACFWGTEPSIITL